jgi:hypothetical protein
MQEPSFSLLHEIAFIATITSSQLLPKLGSAKLSILSISSDPTSAPRIRGN